MINKYPIFRKDFNFINFIKARLALYLRSIYIIQKESILEYLRFVVVFNLHLLINKVSFINEIIHIRKSKDFI